MGDGLFLCLQRLAVRGLGWCLVLALSACGLAPLRVPTEVKASNVNSDAALTPVTRITRDLVKLPPPEFKVPVAVYAFRDQTGQFRGQPESNLSNAVTQGAASILVKALLDSGWYLPIEREGLQNLLNERRIARSIEVPADKGKPGSAYPQLLAANFLVEGGIVGYETNVRTGGQGANLLGIGGETKYRIDQVTVNLRSVDVRNGQVVNSVSVTKTIFSHEISASIYKFVDYKNLLQAEGGYSTNEPSQLAVKEAIESAVIHLTLQGIRDRAWALRNVADWETPLVQNYVREVELQLNNPELTASLSGQRVPLNEPRLVKAAQLPLHLQASSEPLTAPVTATAPPPPPPPPPPSSPPTAAAPAQTPGPMQAPVTVTVPVPPLAVIERAPAPAPLAPETAPPVVAPRQLTLLDTASDSGRMLPVSR
jgi:curli production assembly/transport component CsgG